MHCLPATRAAPKDLASEGALPSLRAMGDSGVSPNSGRNVFDALTYAVVPAGRTSASRIGTVGRSSPSTCCRCPWG